jgi:hypothetical protein
MQYYSPLHIELDGSSQRNIYYPYMETFDPNSPDGKYDTFFQDYYAGALSGFYPAIFYHNLKSVSEAASDPYYKNPGVPVEPGITPSTITPAFIFSELSLKLFHEKVVCSGGDYKKTW